MINAKIVLDSVNTDGNRLTTMELTFPRSILAEVNTHRMLSKNAASSRAIPAAKMLQRVREDPFIPHWWGLNEPGMQAFAEADEPTQTMGRAAWMLARDLAVTQAEMLAGLGFHKQIVNRLVEPFMWCTMVVSGTEWENFLTLRDHPAAEPHFQILAKAVRAARDASTPTFRRVGHNVDSWHLPYVTEGERSVAVYDGNLPALVKASVARCARVSYLNHDQTAPSIENDLKLYAKLADSRPKHASPLEHAARAAYAGEWFGNFHGWHQHRKDVVGENIPG